MNQETRNRIVALLSADYEELESYDQVGDRWNVSGALVWRILNEEYLPKKPEVLEQMTAKLREYAVIETAIDKIKEQIRRVKRLEYTDPGIIYGMEYAIEVLEGLRANE